MSSLKIMKFTMKSRRYTFVFFVTITAFFSILLSCNYIFDPWQLFHKPWFREVVFINNARFQDAGIINSYSFDSVIVGNSMAENFSAKEASEQLGGTFVNLSLAGSLFSERSIVLRHVFDKKKIKRVIISLDHFPYEGVGQFNKQLPPELFDFLYNNNPLDDFRIYFDINLFRCWNLEKNCLQQLPGLRRKSLDDLYSWFPYYIKAFGGTDAWCYWSTRSPHFKEFLESIISVSNQIKKGKTATWKKTTIAKYEHNAQATFDAYILPFVRAHPETQFYFFVPPYSRLWLAMQEQFYVSYFQTYLSFIQHIVTSMESYPNALFFGFGTLDFTADIANYKDQSHYHKDINSKMLHLMARKTHVLTSDNVSNYLKLLKKQAHDYDLSVPAQTFQTCLSSLQ